MIGGLLCLDLAARAGWAYGKPGDVAKGGVWQLPPTSRHGEQMSAFTDVLCDALALMQPECVLMEAPLSLHGQNNLASAYQQFGLSSHTESNCYRYETRCLQAKVDDVRREVFGSCRPWKDSKLKKNWIVNWCRANGYPDLEDHNHADAIVLWIYGCRIFEKKGRWA